MRRKAGERVKTEVCRLGSRHGKLKACATGFIVFAVGYAAFGQQPAPVAKFSISSQLVVEAVSVKDKNGNPVEGLTAKDFVVTENGVPQTIAFCEYQKLDNTPAPAATPEIDQRLRRRRPRR